MDVETLQLMFCWFSMGEVYNGWSTNPRNLTLSETKGNKKAFLRETNGS